MVTYRRSYEAGGIYFFMVNLQNRQSTLLTDNIGLLREALIEVKKNYPFTIDAIVILPDHLHTLWTLPSDDANYSVRWQKLKSQVGCAQRTVNPYRCGRLYSAVSTLRNIDLKFYLF